MSKLRTQSGKVINLKTNFNVLSKIDATFTGGKIEVSSSGEYLFTTCGDKIQILNIETGRVEQTLVEEEDNVTSFALSPDDQFLVTACHSMLLRQWDWKDVKQTRSWKAIHLAPVSVMSFDCTSTLLATGSSDSTIKIWDVIKQYCTHNLKGSQGVISVVKFHPSPKCLQLFSAADDHKIRIWDLQKSKCISILESHFSVVTSLTFSHDIETLISSGRDKVINVWDLPNRKLHKTIPVFESLESVVMLPQNVSYPGCNEPDDEEYFITGGSKGYLRIWSLSKGKCVYPLNAEEPTDSKSHREITLVTFCEQRQAIVVTTFDHNIIFYDITSLEMNKQFVGYNDEILDVKFMGVGDSHIAMATNSDQLRVYNRETMSCQLLQAHKDIILSVDVNVGGNMLITSSKDNTIRLWCQDDGCAWFTCVGLGVGHTHAVGVVAWSRLDSKFVVSGSQDCTIKVWDIPLVVDKHSVAKLSAKFTEKAHDKNINSISVSPNDKLIATGSQDKTAKVWQASDGSLVGVLRGHKRGLWCVQFSPVDQCIATSSGDGTIKLWAISSMSCVKTLQGHTNSVLKVVFLTRGTQLLSSGSDGLIKLWTIKTNECVQTFDEHHDKVWCLSVSKTEDVVISGGADSSFIIWKDVSELEAQKEYEASEEQILREQELSNLLQHKNYTKALALAITLNQPFRVLNIVKDLLIQENGEKELTSAIRSFREDQIDSILKFLTNWNTNAKNSYIAQAVLSIILRSTPPSELMQRANMKEVIEGLLPYTERHFQRMNRLLQQSMFVDYCWKAMKLSSNNEPPESTLIMTSEENSGKEMVENENCCGGESEETEEANDEENSNVEKGETCLEEDEPVEKEQENIGQEREEANDEENSNVMKGEMCVEDDEPVEEEQENTRQETKGTLVKDSKRKSKKKSRTMDDTIPKKKHKGRS